MDYSKTLNRMKGVVESIHKNYKQSQDKGYGTFKGLTEMLKKRKAEAK